MEAKLTVVAGKANKKSIALTPPTKIGRSRDADLTIPHPMISRQHCEVFEANGLLMVRDVGSLNGTMVGGRRIKEAPLPPLAEFTVGPLTFRAEYQYEGDLSKLPAPVWADDDETTLSGVTEPSVVAERSVKSKAVEPVTEDEPAAIATAGKAKPAEDPESSSGAFDAFLAEPG
jgi:predicted component of type VI protein secretion system